MTRIVTRRLAHAVLLCAGLLAATAVAADPQAVRVTGVWARETPPVASVGATYLTVENPGPSADRLLGAGTPAAERVEIHRTSEHQGMMRMRQLDAVEVPAGETVRFVPGGHHLMLIGLRVPLAEGGRFPLRLRFERAGEIEVEVVVRGLTAGVDDHAGHHH